MSRAYDYACPAFGGFSVPPPTWESPKRNISHRTTAALIKQASILSNSSGSMSRGNSLEGRAPLSRTDSSPRSPLARMDSGPRSPIARVDSLSSRNESYSSSTSASTLTGAGPRTYNNTTSYKSPYGNNYRNFSYK